MTAIRTSHERRVDRARALRRTLLADRTLIALAIAAGVWLCAYAVAALMVGSETLAGRIVNDVVFLVPEAPIPVLAFLAARQREGRGRRFWLLMAGFAVLWLAA